VAGGTLTSPARFRVRPTRMKLRSLLVLALAVGALAVPSVASALVAPSIDPPGNGAVFGPGARTFTFSMPSDDGTATGYTLLRATPNGGVCDGVALAAATIPAGATATGAAPLAPAPLVDGDTIADGQWCYWVESTDGLATADSPPVKITFDTTAPTVHITGNPAPFTQLTSASFTFTVSDGTSVCQIDLGAFTSCSSPKSFTSLAESSHTFTVQSTDAAGNVGSDTYTWTVDHTNPVVMITPSSQPASLSNSSTASFVFSANEGSPVCALDSPTFVACTSSTTMSYSGLSTGSHTFTVKSTDSAANVGSDTYTWTVDVTPPTVPGNLTLVGPASRHTPPVFTFSTSTDLHGPLSYRLYRNGTFTGLTATTGSIADSTIATDGSNDGDYTYTVRAVDAAGNESASSGAIAVTMDSGPPSVPANVHAMANPTRLGPVITWSASTGVPATYQVFRNGDLIGTVNAPTAVFGDASVAGDGIYSYTVRAVDGAGNTTLDSIATKVVYDTTAPGTPIVAAVAGPTSGTVNLTWPAVADAGSGVAGYLVRRSAPGGPVPTSPFDGTSVCGTLSAASLGCGDTGLTVGASYRYAVFATDAVGNVSGGGQSAAVLVPSLTDKKPPKAPTSLHAQVTGSKVALSWKNPKLDLAKVVIVWNSKRAPRSASDGTSVYHGSGTRVVLNLGKLPSGKHVRFAVFALDKAGNVSTAARATLSVPTASPLSLAPGGKLSGNPSLSWNAVVGATYYNVQVFVGTEATKRVDVAWPTRTSWTLPGSELKKGTTYTWYVWPGLGVKSAAHYGKLIGKVTFTYTG
jgi:hypothetical protein